MSLLATNFRLAVKKEKDPRMSTEARCDVGYSTGFLNVDFTNGQVIHVKSEEKNLNQFYYSVGITDGSMATFIGRAGCGKTTFIAQAAANIVRPFKTSCIFEDSVEGGLTWSRREVLSGFHDKELQERYIVRNSGVTAENFYQRIKMIHDMKLENPSEYMYDTGLLDTFGVPIRAFEPTIYILDSIAMIMPDKYTSEDELSGGMSSTAGAKVIAQIMRTIVPMLKAANIILFIVNHILEDVSINPMQHKKAQISFLNQGERLPKGNTVIYLSNNIVRIDDAEKLKDDAKFKVAGNISKITFVKSRTNRPNVETKLVYDQDNGFDPILSLYLFLQEKGRVNGSGVGMYIDDKNDYKFSMGNIKDKLKNKPEFKAIFMKAAQEELCKLPKLPSNEMEAQRSATDDLYSMCMSCDPTVNDISNEMETISV